MKKFISLFIVLLSFITLRAQTITIVQPNGGEILYPCESYLITWTQSGGLSNYFNIDYSLDGGTIWASVTTNYLSTNGQYSWTVPNVESTTVRIRITDANTPSIFDISDQVFSINTPIELISPNGGEVWIGGSMQQITWSAPGTTDNFRISYSRNNGISWTTIASNYNTTSGVYNWSVPNTPSTSCLVRVEDYNQTCKADISDQVFTIEPAVPVVLYPDGGEILRPGCGQYITWETSSYFSNVRIEYSLDNGATYTTIVTNTSNDGSHYWTTPNSPTTNALIKISNTDDLTVHDVSNSPFEIAPVVKLISPNGGESFIGCDVLPITWEKSRNCASNYGIRYTTNNGATWNNISTSISANSSVLQTYNWNIPNGISSTDCKIEVYSTSSSYPGSDQSDNTFSLIPSNDITVSFPNGGEVFNVGDTVIVTWTNLPTSSGQFNVYYGNSTIATNVTGNNYQWIVPNSPTISGFIKVRDYTNSCKEDISDADFTILPKDPLLTSPNGGEVYYSGTAKTITWDNSSFYSNVRLEYSVDNGLTWKTIVTATTNDGSHYWVVPNEESLDCLVKVSSSNDVLNYDISDALFTIRPAVTVLTPNGNIVNGSFLGGCTVTSITFDRSPAWNRYRIEYSLNNGTSWSTIQSSWLTNSNPATYNWDIPNITSASALVRVTPVGTSYSDDSDNVFTITKPVTLIQPTFGGILQVGSVYDIEWVSDGISNIYDLYYSVNNGTSWNTIVTGYTTSTNQYPWAVPNNISSNCLIRVIDNVDNCKLDISDYAFTIANTAPPISVLTPNGGETLSGCANYDITWSVVNPSGAYDLAYSTDLGGTWNTIELNYTTTTNIYDWSVPAINSSSVLVRVKESGGTNQDISEALFTITSVELEAYPGVATINSGAAVQISTTGGFNSFVWTPSFGLDNPNIENPVASPTQTTQYIVASSNGTCTLRDTVLINVNTVNPTPSATCSAYSSTPGLLIDGALLHADTISIMGSGINALADLNVIMKIDHEFLGDLEITLISPTGTMVDLMKSQCSKDENMDVEFDDESSNPFSCAATTLLGSYTVPNGMLSDFDGETFDGQWILQVVDNFPSADIGELVQWCLVPADAGTGVVLSTKLYLEGPYETGLSMMADDLRINNFIPTREPYTQLGYTLTSGGGETVSPAVFAPTGNDAIVDWVIVELRDSTDPTTVLASRAALLQADGDVCDLDGSSSVMFSGVVTGNYFIVVDHRNHLAAMSATPILLNNTAGLSFDFTTTAAHGTDAQKVLGSINVFYESDINGSGTVDAADRSNIWNNRNQTGYILEDTNMNGTCDAAERSQAWNNRNKSSKVPY